MIEEEIEIEAGDGSTEAVVVRQDGETRPGVLWLTDISGIRAASRAQARRVAELGYTVLMPNVFYRTSRTPIERARERIAELTTPLTPDAMVRDGVAYLDALGGRAGARAGGVAVVGHCFTGQMALRIAAARPDAVAAAASFHGGGLWTSAPTSPHLVLPHVEARLYFGHAVEDRSMPAASIAELDKALAAWGGKFESEVYDGAHHGWTLEDNAAYNPAQAQRAFEKLSELLAATL